MGTSDERRGSSGAEKLRDVRTLCPQCMKKIAGSVVLKGDRVTLYRECGEHGPTDMLLSRNARLYADWDRFYFSVLKRGKPRGRIINYWVVCTSECQMQCSFCHADVQDRYAEEMSRADFDSVIRHDTRAKLTISGGEPTLHPDLIYCIREAVRAGRNIQLATNGICLADGEFCKKLGAEGLRNVRLSCELLDPKKAPTSEFGRWLDTKFHAIENLERYGYSVTLSPTIFKGVNEELLLESLACAAARPCITTVSVNGFSWVGHGTVRDRDEMIMPDEMMDLIARRFGIDDRESLFTLQKMLFTLLQLLNVRACAYTQLMLFVRRAGALEPIVRYFNMKRMKKGMRFWEKFSRAPYPIQLAAFCLAMTYGLAGRSCALFGDIVKVGARYLWRGNGSLRPSRFLTVILNTNCSTLTMDEEVGKQCMSGVLIKKGGKVFRSQSSDLLIDKEIEKHRRATGGPADSLEHCACLVELEK